MSPTNRPGLVRVCIECLVLATVYFLTAKLGQTLAIPPGNVTPVWIPSGIILAVILLRGNYLWPGIFIGAFSGNIWAYLDTQTFSNIDVSILSASINGIGDTLGTLLSAFLIKRFIGVKELFSKAINVVKFIIYGALISSTISATFGVSGLALSQFIPWTEYFTVWSTWLVGDAVGVLFITPVLVYWRHFKFVKQLKSKQSFKLILYFLAVLVVSPLATGHIQVSRVIEFSFLLAILPIIIFAVYFFDFIVALIALILVAVFAVLATSNKLGLFAMVDLNTALIALQAFLSSISITGYLLIGTLFEQRAAQQALKDSEQYSKSIVKYAAEGIITVDINGHIISFNSAAEQIFGYTESEIIGQAVEKLIPEDKREQHSGRIKGLQSNENNRVIGHGREVVGLNKNGGHIDLYIALSESSFNQEKRYIAMVHDISAAKKYRQLLKEREANFRFFAESSFEALAIHDNGVIVDANSRFFEMFQYSRDELLGNQTIPLLLTPESAKVVYKNISNNYEKPYEVICVKKDGTKFPAEILARNVVFNEQQVRATAIRDISEFYEQKRILSEAKEQAIKGNKAKTKFIASMSHELRTPLNSVIGFSQLQLTDSSASSSIKSNAKEILSAGRHLLEIINDILDLAKIESEQIQLKIKQLNVNQSIIECVDSIRNLAQKRHIEIELELSRGAPLIINVDETRLRQILLNLLSNAIKYNRENGKILVRSSSLANEVLIEVIDEGVGISNNKLKSLFEPFNRLGLENSNIPGTGIGLVIVKELVDQMKGNIQVSSELDNGSNFCVSFPQHQ